MGTSEAKLAGLVRSRVERPEEVELSKKRAELGELLSRLADLELQLLNLRVELSEFESHYAAAVGGLYTELDEVDALIAERLAQREPTDANTKAAKEARQRAQESADTIKDVQSTPKLLRSDSLRDLYRIIAKCIHPDLSDSEQDRALRERLMTEANLAYARGDESRLQSILEVCTLRNRPMALHQNRCIPELHVFRFGGEN